MLFYNLSLLFLRFYNLEYMCINPLSLQTMFKVADTYEGRWACRSLLTEKQCSEIAFILWWSYFDYFAI